MLHVVTDDRVVQAPDFVERARVALQTLGSRGALHLRGHGLPGRTVYGLAAALAPVAAGAGAWLVVNDRLDVARAARALGVQVGRRSLTVAEVRRVAPTLRVGVSVHTADEAVAASEAGADWVMAGHVFATPSHEGRGRGLSFIRAVGTVSRVPVVAIGGVRPSDIAALRDAGAYGVAVVRGVWDAPAGVEQAVATYLGGFAP